MKIKIFFALLISLTFLTPAVHARRDEVKDEQRLEFLRQATGSSSSAPSSTSTFQARLDAVLDTSVDAERSTVALDEAQARQKILAAENAEIAYDLKLEQEAEERGALKTQDEKKIETGLTQTKLDSTEKAYQKTRSDLQAEFDERLRNLESPESKKQQVAASPTAAGASSLRPSLANNPFYISQQKSAPQDSELGFEERKAIVVSRLVNYGGMDGQEAQALVSQSSSAEELIMVLMQDHGYTYGDAADLVS